MSWEKKERHHFGSSRLRTESCLTCIFRDGDICQKNVAAPFYDGSRNNQSHQFHCDLHTHQALALNGEFMLKFS